MQTKRQNLSKEFIKDLLDTVPSNKYLSKALGVNPQTVSNYRKKLSKVKGGPWSICPRNTRLFNPKIIEACIIHNCTTSINAVNTLEKVYNLAKTKGINHPLPVSMKNISEIEPIFPISQNRFPHLKQTGPDWTSKEIALLDNLIGLKLNERQIEANRIANIRGCTANAVLQKFLRIMNIRKFEELRTQKLISDIENGADIELDMDLENNYEPNNIVKANSGWTTEEKDKLRKLRPLTIIERNKALKFLTIDFGRTFTAIQKEYSKLNIADRKEMAAAKISALDEVRNRIAQATTPTTVATKPESVNIILNGKEVSFHNNMEYKIENNKMFLVQKETKVIETLTELQ